MRLMSRLQLRQFIKENNLKSALDVQNALKDLFAETLQEMLEAELDDTLGYAKNDTQNKQTGNRRNGHSKKTVRSEYGEIDIEVPLDREGEFEPLVVKKHQKSITGIQDQILALYARGVSTRDIQDHLQQLYGVEVSPTLISNVTNKIMPLIKECVSTTGCTTSAQLVQLVLLPPGISKCEITTVRRLILNVPGNVVGNGRYRHVRLAPNAWLKEIVEKIKENIKEFLFLRVWLLVVNTS